MGNVRRKPVNKKLLFKELLGADGKQAMRKMKDEFEKQKAREKSMLASMLVSNRHFECKMDVRMKDLKRKRDESKAGTYRRQSLCWRDSYRKTLKKRRCS